MSLNISSDTRRLTQPELYVSGMTRTSDACAGVDQQNNTWRSRLLDLFCGRFQKVFANKDKMHVKVWSLPAAINGTVPYDSTFNLLSSVKPSIVKVLFVFGKDDQQTEILEAAARKLGWSVSVVKSADKAAEAFNSRHYDAVIIDRRNHWTTEADSICRSLKSDNYQHNSLLLALVKKSFFTNVRSGEIALMELLEVGYSRALMECSNEDMWMNELIAMYSSEIQPRVELAASRVLLLTIDRCRDMVHITNDSHVIQFVNKPTERLLGYNADEIGGKVLSEFVSCENFSLIEQQLEKGREFEGNMNCKRKSNDVIVINCRIIPYCANGKKPTHYIYVYDTTYLLENSGTSSSNLTTYQQGRNSVYSLRRASFDVRSIASETQRRTSKLHNLPLEAPITRVIGLLTNAMVSAINPETSFQIDRAIDILAAADLYVPRVKDDSKINDPIASDLISALLAQPRDSRRSSNESTAGRVSTLRVLSGLSTSRRLAEINHGGSQEVKDLLKSSLSWDFDIFKLETVTNKRPLVFLGMSIMNLFHASERLCCDDKTMENWLTIIELNYQATNNYHNSTHAADVLQATAKFMQSERIKQMLDPLDEIAALIAAMAHDIDHPGKSSQFLCNSDNKLAILYNDLSVLESHHAALTFKLTLSDDSVNIFKNLDRESYGMIRHNVIDMILATEMTKHFEYLAKFVNVCSSRSNDSQSECFESYSDDSIDMDIMLLPENITLVKRMMIKCADVSNPTRPLRCCVEWAKRIAEEYFNQTDEEIKRQLPVVMPMFDRNTCSIPKSQIGFIDFIINDMMMAWNSFIDMPELADNMRCNYDKWKEYQDQGITTLQDIEKIQREFDLQNS